MRFFCGRFCSAAGGLPGSRPAMKRISSLLFATAWIESCCPLGQWSQTAKNWVAEKFKHESICSAAEARLNLGQGKAAAEGLKGRRMSVEQQPSASSPQPDWNAAVGSKPCRNQSPLTSATPSEGRKESRPDSSSTIIEHLKLLLLQEGSFTSSFTSRPVGTAAPTL